MLIQMFKKIQPRELICSRSEQRELYLVVFGSRVILEKGQTFAVQPPIMSLSLKNSTQQTTISNKQFIKRLLLAHQLQILAPVYTIRTLFLNIASVIQTGVKLKELLLALLCCSFSWIPMEDYRVAFWTSFKTQITEMLFCKNDVYTSSTVPAICQFCAVYDVYPLICHL